ncbi:MAG: RsmD family RNA methyltransferase [Acidimicrobiales bacterium]
MRVVAGSARGRRLVAPSGLDTRPTSDRAREAIFNALTSLGAIDNRLVLDLFAGSGALGIEALSRGAAHATFVDDDRRAVAAIRANLAACGLADRATVVQRDVPSYLAGEHHHHHDLALVDPPYAFDEWPRVLDGVPADIVVIESDRGIDPGPNWLVVREKRYGGTVVVIARHARPSSEE